MNNSQDGKTPFHTTFGKLYSDVIRLSGKQRMSTPKTNHQWGVSRLCESIQTKEHKNSQELATNSPKHKKLWIAMIVCWPDEDPLDKKGKKNVEDCNIGLICSVILYTSIRYQFKCCWMIVCFIILFALESR